MQIENTCIYIYYIKGGKLPKMHNGFCRRFELKSFIRVRVDIDEWNDWLGAWIIR